MLHTQRRYASQQRGDLIPPGDGMNYWHQNIVTPYPGYTWAWGPYRDSLGFEATNLMFIGLDMFEDQDVHSIDRLDYQGTTLFDRSQNFVNNGDAFFGTITPDVDDVTAYEGSWTKREGNNVYYSRLNPRTLTHCCSVEMPYLPTGNIFVMNARIRLAAGSTVDGVFLEAAASIGPPYQISQDNTVYPPPVPEPLNLLMPRSTKVLAAKGQ